MPANQSEAENIGLEKVGVKAERGIIATDGLMRTNVRTPDQTVGDLFAGAILPGLVLVGLYAVYLVFRLRGAPAGVVAHGAQLRGRQQHGRGVTYLVDFDEAGTVGRDGVERCRRVRVQFQFARGFLFPPSGGEGGESESSSTL